MVFLVGQGYLPTPLRVTHLMMPLMPPPKVTLMMTLKPLHLTRVPHHQTQRLKWGRNNGLNLIFWHRNVHCVCI